MKTEGRKNMMTNYQKIVEMLLRYGTPEIEADVVSMVSDCIFKHSDIDEIKLSDDTVYRCPWKNAIAKMEEAFPTPILSEEEKIEILNFFKEITEDNKTFRDFLRKTDEAIRRLRENDSGSETVLH